MMWVYGNPWSQTDPRYLRTGSGQMTRLEDNKNFKSEEQISTVQTLDQDTSSGKKKKKKKEKLKLSWSQDLQDVPDPEGGNATSQDLDLILRNVPDFTLQKRGNLRPGQKVKLSKIKPRKSAKIFPDSGEFSKLPSEGEFEQKDLTTFSNINNNNESEEVERNEGESKTQELDVDDQRETNNDSNEDLETEVDENTNIKPDKERPEMDGEEVMEGPATREENTEEDSNESIKSANEETTEEASKEEEDSSSVSAEEKDGEEAADSESSAVREEPGASPDVEDTEDSYSLSRETVLENDLHVSEAETPEPMADIELDGNESLKNDDKEVVVEEASTTEKDLDIEDTNDVLTILERDNGLNFSRDFFPEQTLDTTIDQVVSQVSTKAVIDQSRKDEEKADFAAFNWKPNVDFFQFGSESRQTSENIFSFGRGTPALPQTVKKRQIVTRPRSRSIQRLKRSGLA